MTTFLQKIAVETMARLVETKKTTPIEKLRDGAYFARTCHDCLSAFKKSGTHIIAEVKFASPSEGVIYTDAAPSESLATQIGESYLAAGARMLSVLTEPAYFKGSLSYLRALREKTPEALLLRKEFMVDSYQLTEAKAYGADAILLIVAMTEPSLTKDLYQQAQDLGLTPLVEVHDEKELEEALTLGASFIGVNNRNLKTLKIDLDIGRRLATAKPPNSVFICESGLSSSTEIHEMRALGYDGFLMGSTFMRGKDPGATLKKLLDDVTCA